MLWKLENFDYVATGSDPMPAHVLHPFDMRTFGILKGGCQIPYLYKLASFLIKLLRS